MKMLTAFRAKSFGVAAADSLALENCQKLFGWFYKIL
jgi:hypothetical protein